MFKVTSKTHYLLKGGETMKKFGLVIGLVVGLSTASFAATETVSFDIYQGWNLIAAPCVPVDPAPLSVFAGAIDGIDGNLTRNDPAAGGITWDSLGGDEAFGNVLLGDGYWLYQNSEGESTISYEGLPDGIPDVNNNETDMWISLPGAGNGNGGWHIIGNPFNHDVSVDSGAGTGDKIFFTDGTTVKTWGEAVDAGWVSDVMTGNDPATGGINVQYNGLGDTDKLSAGKGYWLQTIKDNLAMIIPATTDAQ